MDRYNVTIEYEKYAKKFSRAKVCEVVTRDGVEFLHVVAKDDEEFYFNLDKMVSHHFTLCD